MSKSDRWAVSGLRLATLGLLAAGLFSACSSSDDNPTDPTLAGDTIEVVVVAEGLLNPVGLAQLPDGSILVAEEGTGDNDASAGVSLVTVDGQVGRIISGLPSSRDSGDLSGVPFVAVDQSGENIYLSHFDAERIFSLTVPQGGFLLGDPASLDDLTEAMLPLNNVRLTNPFDMAFTTDGIPVVSDASQNGVATITRDGTIRFIHRFGELTDPDDSDVRIDAVPTGIAALEDEFLVTLTGGCPFPLGSGRLVSIDGERNESIIADGLNMPIDVAVDSDGTIWLLEFTEFTPGASCFTGEGYVPGTGRLSRVTDAGGLDVVIEDLDFPGSILPLGDGSVLVSEVFSGRLVQVLPAAQTKFLDQTAERVEISTGWRFDDVASERGISFVHGSFIEAASMDPVAAMGGGLCWLDFDNDGFLDLYLVNSHATNEVELWAEAGGLPTNGLFRNSGGNFTDVSTSSQTDLALRGNGCVAADFNLDGLVDIYVTADGPNALLLNNGDGTFSETAADAFGVQNADEWNTAAVVGDINGDGWPDLFVASYIDLALTIDHPSGAFPQDYLGIRDHLFLNQGVGSDGVPIFLDIAIEAGITSADRGLGALLSDFDQDGDLDLYVTNDGNPNRLYRNDSESAEIAFVDVTQSAAVGDSGSGMGVAGGDFTGDLSFDLVVTNWDRELNAVYSNLGGDELGFLYSTFRLGISGLGNNQTGWGTAWADLDNDTDLDLFIANGHVPVTDLAADAEFARVYRNNLADGEPRKFDDISAAIGLMDLGPISARGSALADFDNDGDLDIAVNVVGGSPVLLLNSNNPGNSIVIELDGIYPGAVLRVDLSDGTQMLRELHVGGSYLASEDPRFIVGIGDVSVASVVTVTWPDGVSETKRDVSGTVLFAHPGTVTN